MNCIYSYTEKIERKNLNAFESQLREQLTVSVWWTACVTLINAHNK